MVSVHLISQVRGHTSLFLTLLLYYISISLSCFMFLACFPKLVNPHISLFMFHYLLPINCSHRLWSRSWPCLFPSVCLLLIHLFTSYLFASWLLSSFWGFCSHSNSTYNTYTQPLCLLRSLSHSRTPTHTCIVQVSLWEGNT